ncbi:MAG TPA: hypothetical protein VFQ13_23780 [Anaerolineales bacterium]|nr:hypothetical protein [Anaerolineales bacterium]
MFELNAPIIPGKSAAGVSLGQSIKPILPANLPTSVEQLSKSEKFSFGSVELWVEDGRVIQIGVRAGYEGTLHSTIGIGSTIAEVQSAIGEVIEDDEDNLVVPNEDGWCFETEVWQNGEKVEDNLSSRISAILVYPAAHES